MGAVVLKCAPFSIAHENASAVTLCFEDNLMAEVSFFSVPGTFRNPRVCFADCNALHFIIQYGITKANFGEMISGTIAG